MNAYTALAAENEIFIFRIERVRPYIPSGAGLSEGGGRKKNLFTLLA